MVSNLSFYPDPDWSDPLNLVQSNEAKVRRTICFQADQGKYLSTANRVIRFSFKKFNKQITFHQNNLLTQLLFGWCMN
jgi:hypothetical protein